MKFYGKPNELVTHYTYNRFKKKQMRSQLAQFDESGEYETEDTKMIELLKPHFKYCDKSLKFKCKLCDFETDNKGELLAHYRKYHPKTESDDE